MTTKKRRGVWREIKKHKVMYLFLLPAVILVLIFAYLPMGGIVMAFQKFDLVKGFAHSPWVGLKHFATFLKDADFFLSVKNTLVINLLSILFGFPLPVFFAIMIFSMAAGPYKHVTQTISYLPHFVSWVVVAGLVYKILDVNTGIVNVLLMRLGYEPVPFMREPDNFWAIITTVSIWKELGWGSIIYLAALSGIPAEQYEAATVDGANSRQRLLYITLPGMAPTIGLMFIFTVGGLLKDSFDAVYNLRNALVSSTANTIEYYVLAKGVLGGKLSLAAAIGLAQSVFSLALVVSANAISRKIRGYGAF